MALSAEQEGALCARWLTICIKNLGQSNDLKIVNWWGHAIFWLSFKNHSFSPDFYYVTVVSIGINLGHLFKFLLCFWNLFLRIQYATSCHFIALYFCVVILPSNALFLHISRRLLLIRSVCALLQSQNTGNRWLKMWAFSRATIFNLDSRIFCFCCSFFFFFLLFYSLMVISICLYSFSLLVWKFVIWVNLYLLTDGCNCWNRSRLSPQK